jgi:nitroreductase
MQHYYTEDKENIMEQKFTPSDITKAIHRSQHTQRNFDLSKQMPAEHLELFKTAATQCPSKQNVAHYKIHMITNRDVIERVHALTPIARHDGKGMTSNSQVLANLLVVFEEYRDMSNEVDQGRNDETTALYAEGKEDARAYDVLERDASVAVGIAAGYLNLVGGLMGYGTGCCQCMDEPAVMEALGLTGRPLLLMGIGFKNEDLNRRVHHSQPDVVFPTRQKQEILVDFIA